jgi:hypothetical protein
MLAGSAGSAGNAGSRGGLLVGVGAGLIIAALLVVQAVSSSGGLGAKTETGAISSRTGPATATSNNASVSSGGLYYVSFFDSGPCGANSTTGTHLTEWGVQLGNRTRTEPTNITLSEIPEDGSYSATSSFNMTRIVFLVPSGVYPFTLYPTALMRVGTSNGTYLAGPTGVITVTNSDIAVYTVSAAMSAECSQ